MKDKYTLDGIKKPLIWVSVAYILYFPQAFTSPDKLMEITNRFSRANTEENILYRIEPEKREDNASEWRKAA